MSKREFVQLIKNMRDTQHKRREDKSPEVLEELRLATAAVDAALSDLLCEPEPDLLIEVRIGEMKGYNLAKVSSPTNVMVADSLDMMGEIFKNLKENEKEYPGRRFGELDARATVHGTFLKTSALKLTNKLAS